RRGPASLPLLLAGAPLLTGCGAGLGPSADDPGAAPVVITELPREPSASEATILERSNDFAFDLLREVAGAREEGTNVFLSPLSASMALGMLLNGAAGDTHDEIRDMLGFAGMTPTEVNEAYHGLLEL